MMRARIASLNCSARFPRALAFAAALLLVSPLFSAAGAKDRVEDCRIGIYGMPITPVVFPHTDHGILEYETATDGTRVSTRNTDGYFAMMRDFILHGDLGTRRYGESPLTLPTSVAKSVAPPPH